MNDPGRRLRVLLVLSLATLVSFACSSTPQLAQNSDQVNAGVHAVLEEQQAAWNKGDIDAFMNGYDRAETTTFVSGDELHQGWQMVLERYKKTYKSREDMGTLSFSELSIKPLSTDFALADGRWQLTRANDKPHGRFTLLFQRINGNWRIVHDTTTSGAP